jgi:Fe-S cluster assembly iron-binding protein IscA
VKKLEGQKEQSFNEKNQKLTINNKSLEHLGGGKFLYKDDHLSQIFTMTPRYYLADE